MTIAPPPLRSMAGISCFMHRNTPRRSTATIRSNCSSAMSASGASGSSIPALLNATSSPPSSATVRSTALGDLGGIRDVARRARGRVRPPASTSRAVSRMPAASTSTTATRGLRPGRRQGGGAADAAGGAGDERDACPVSVGGHVARGLARGRAEGSALATVIRADMARAPSVPEQDVVGEVDELVGEPAEQLPCGRRLRVSHGHALLRVRGTRRR